MKQANAAATILVVMLLVIGGVVITYKPLLRQDTGIDYGRAFATTRNLLDRVTYDAEQAIVSHGFKTPTTEQALYCNKPSIPPITTVEETFQEQFKDAYNLTDQDGRLNITISLGAIALDNRILALDNFTINFTSKDEERLLTQNTTYDVSELYYVQEKVKDWLACDAGGLQHKLQDLRDQKSCAYDICTCGELETYPAYASLAEERGALTQTDIKQLLISAVGELNNLFTEGSCAESGAFDPTYTCKPEFLDANAQLELDTTITTDYEDNFFCAQGLGTFAGYGTTYGWYDWKDKEQYLTCSQAPEDQVPTSTTPVIASSTPPALSSQEGHTDDTDRVLGHFFYVNQDLALSVPVRCTSTTGKPTVQFWVQLAAQGRCDTTRPPQGSPVLCPSGTSVEPDKCVAPGALCGVCGVCDDQLRCSEKAPEGEPGSCPVVDCTEYVCDGIHQGLSACVPDKQAPDDTLCGESNACYDMLCESGSCTKVSTYDGSRITCDTDVPNSCYQGVCNSEGNCVAELIENPEAIVCSTDQDNPCIVQYCTADGTCAAQDSYLPADQPCKEATTCQEFYCDDQHQCTPATINQGLRCSNIPGTRCAYNTCSATGSCDEVAYQNEGYSCGNNGCLRGTCDGEGGCTYTQDDSLCTNGPCQGTCNLDGTCSYGGTSCSESSACGPLTGTCDTTGSCILDKQCCSTYKYTCPAEPTAYCCEAKYTTDKQCVTTPEDCNVDYEG